MNLERFLRTREPAWNELAQIVAEARTRPDRLPPARLLRLGALYRAAAADLAYARRRFPADPAVATLEEFVGRARHLVYASERRSERLWGFLAHGYWARIRERPALLAISALLLFVPAGLAALWAHGDPADAAQVMPGRFDGLTEPRTEGTDLGLTAGEAGTFSARIFTNNIQVTFVAFAGGMTAGLATAAALVFNGLVLGVVAGLAVQAGNGSPLVQLVVPHGLLELSCIVVAGAAGLRMGWALVDPGRGPRGERLVQEARAAAELALGTAPWLVVAGLVEGFVTPEGLGVGGAMAAGVGLAAAYWALVCLPRRGDPAAPAVTPVPAT